MAEKKPRAAKALGSINARSVDTNRVIRISSGTGNDFGGYSAEDAFEWRQYTFGRLLLYAFSAYETRILESYCAAGFPEVRQVHFAVMRHIDVAGGTRIGDLATRAGVSKAAMGQLALEFERLGLVRITPDPADARAKLVELSRRGRKLMDVTRSSSAAIEREFAAKIGPKQFAALRNGLIALRQTIAREPVG